MEFLDPNDIWKIKDKVLSKVSIIEIAKEYGIELEEKETGNFTHRTYCPLHSGKGYSGKERTPSMFFSKHSNSFCCFGCLEENSLIWTLNGLIEIKDIKVGDSVLGHDAKFHKVLHKEVKRNDIIEIYLKSCKKIGIKLTEDHECIFIKKEDLNNISNGSASLLRKGDFLLFPVISEKDRYINYNIPLNEETCWLIGLWLIKGSINNFTFNNNEFEELGKRTKDILLKYFGINSVISEKDYQIKGNFDIFNNLFSSEKEIPTKFLFLPQELQKCFIDGCLINKSVNFTSKKLIFGLYCIAIQAKLFPFIDYNMNLSIDKYGFYKEIDGILYYLSEIEDMAITQKGPLVKPIETNVVDITVDSVNSFTTNICTLHNCGRTGSVLNLISYMDGTPLIVALTKLAKKVGLINKDGNFDELQLENTERRELFDPDKTIDPYIFKISDMLRNHIRMFIGDTNFEKEFRWMEKVSFKVDSFLSNIGHEDWEYAKDLYKKIDKVIKNRLRIKDKI